MSNLSQRVCEVIVVSLVISAITSVSSIHDYWRKMDQHYDLSYLEPVDETSADTVIGCALFGLRRDVTAFGYLLRQQRCYLYNVDYNVKHIWTPAPGLQFYLRNEEISNDNCIGPLCLFCMPIVETRMTWTEADSTCRLLYSRLLELTNEGIHRCMVMQLQYLRKPTSNRYWLGGEYSTVVNDWTWSRHGNIIGTPDYLWASGEPDNSQTESCALLVPGGNYTVRSADCSERHYALCAQWPPYGGS